MQNPFETEAPRPPQQAAPGNPFVTAPPQIDMSRPDAAKPAAPELQSALPGGNIPVVGAMVQPIGEVLSELRYDKKFRNETAAYGAGSAAAVGGAAVAPEAISAAVSSLPGIAHAAYLWTKENPVLAYAAIEAAKTLGLNSGGLKKLLHMASGVEK
jgi:hypothetical protein